MKPGILKTLVVTLVLSGCYGSLPVIESNAQEPGWGHLTGKIIVEGTIPEVAEIDLSTDDKQYCIDTGQKFTSRELLIGSEGQLKDAYVMMYFGRGDRKRPEVHPSYDEDSAPVTLDNINCRFEPRAIFVRSGQAIEFKNSDRIGHNCHVVTMKFEENCSLGAGQKIEVTMEEASRVPGIVKCDAHPWMEALLLVRDEPYAAITDEDGKFTVKNIPAGEWTFQFWHTKRGFLKELQKDGEKLVGRRGEIKVTIPDGGTLDLGTLTIPIEFLMEDN